MARPIDLHPRVSKPSATPNPADPESYLLNTAACILIAKEGDTPKARQLYRLYVAEFHALEGQPLTHEARETKAFRAAAEAMGWKFVTQH